MNKKVDFARADFDMNDRTGNMAVRKVSEA